MGLQKLFIIEAQQSNMPAIVPHRHCVVCGKAIEPDKQFCSEECEEVYQKERKKQRNYMIFMFVMLFVLLIIIWMPYIRL